MKIRLVLVLFALTVFKTIVQARDPYERQPALDVQHYIYFITLNDTTDRIAGQATITILFKKTVKSFFLDFGGRAQGEGMKVVQVHAGGQPITYSHEGEKLILQAAAQQGQTVTYTVLFQGIPEDGLVISKNKYGDRTFFADHWPDRGHLWLPCIDHPSDKATVDFTILAPYHYQVVASGAKSGEVPLPDGRKITQYQASVPIAMKVTAIGVARFAIEEGEVINNVPQSTWVFPQNQKEGFHDFAVGKKVFTYFNRHIGTYAYEKLAHVQSKTRWGGLENAGNVFYNEKSVTGKGEIEKLIAHEVAHQWFGDAVSENDWHHVWLSEGFANYFANLYWESVYGKEGLKKQMAAERETTINYIKTHARPVVDTTITEIGKVLSANTYDRASFVLHMLRRQVGDSAFWKGIRDYYKKFKNGNVLTGDFRAAMETASGQHLSSFFREWLYRRDIPKVTVGWAFNKASGLTTVTIQQQPGTPFKFPLDVNFRFADGKEHRQTIDVKKTIETKALKLAGEPVSIDLDPDVWLLFEGTVKAPAK